MLNLFFTFFGLPAEAPDAVPTGFELPADSSGDVQIPIPGLEKAPSRSAAASRGRDDGVMDALLSSGGSGTSQISPAATPVDKLPPLASEVAPTAGAESSQNGINPVRLFCGQCRV